VRSGEGVFYFIVNSLLSNKVVDGVQGEHFRIKKVGPEPLWATIYLKYSSLEDFKLHPELPSLGRWRGHL